MVRIQRRRFGLASKSSLGHDEFTYRGIESPDKLMDLIDRSYEINALAHPHTNLDGPAPSTQNHVRFRDASPTTGKIKEV